VNSSWTLNGATLASLGIARLVRERRNQAADTLQFTIPGARLDSAPAFPYGTILTLRRDGIPWFYGSVTSVTISASGQSEDHHYVVSGPWHWLEELVFQVIWPSGLDYTSNCLLNFAPPNTQSPLKIALEACIDYAIANGAPMLKGNIFSDASENALAPVTEIRDWTCAEVIRQQLRWVPQAVTWFDYSTTPPTLHVRWANLLEPVDLPISDCETLECLTRTDLQRSAVVLRYQLISDVNGTPRITYINDVAPPGATGRELGALVQTIDVRGPSYTTTVVEIYTEPIDLTDPDWWIANYAPLQDAGVSNVIVSDVDDTSILNLPQQLKDGQIPSWMTAQTERITVRCRVSYTIDGEQITDYPLAFDIQTTDALGGIYRDTRMTSAGDPFWLGLAAVIYAWLGALKHSGQVTIAEEECTGRVGMENTLNLTGGPGAWASMAAQVQSVVENIDTGLTQITFGPPGHLGASELTELLR
jgi:hypothetical protein